MLLAAWQPQCEVSGLADAGCNVGVWINIQHTIANDEWNKKLKSYMSAQEITQPRKGSKKGRSLVTDHLKLASDSHKFIMDSQIDCTLFLLTQYNFVSTYCLKIVYFTI